HTNSSSAAPPRLIDIGIEPYLIASTLNAIMAQRLVRVICPDCKMEDKPEAATFTSLSKQFNMDSLMVVLKKLELSGKATKPSELTFYIGKGCDKCSNTGYKGRIGVHEILENTPEIEDLIVKHATAQDIEEQAVKQGMITMWQDGFIKAVQGVTTIEEILRVTKE
ncbi:MAG TPA: type II/IV secretion system protein, partial [Candidatus Doudnabacteria bacterium]|nr:type II/IV secretion system protein [Candidatus Doudnabacteria bacterium]